jgi:hypothetical protein
MKNPYAKTRKVENPYEVWQAADWFWVVLKKWQVDDNKPYARWFCAVYTPLTYGSFNVETLTPEGSCDMGDAYVSEIKSVATCVYRDPSVV